jgi:hypothetical protein
MTTPAAPVAVEHPEVVAVRPSSSARPQAVLEPALPSSALPSGGNRLRWATLTVTLIVVATAVAIGYRMKPRANLVVHHQVTNQPLQRREEPGNGETARAGEKPAAPKIGSQNLLAGTGNLPLPTKSPAPGAKPAPAPRLAGFDPHAGRFTNSLGMEFVPVAVGSEGRRVWFCTCQTSVANFNDYMKVSASEIRPQLRAVLSQKADLPVRDVTWEQARQFCEWLSKKDQALGVRYRLPSDAEWSAAAGNGELHLGENGAEWCADDPPEARGPDRDQWRTIRGPNPESANERGKDYHGEQKTFDLKDWLGFRCVAEAAPAAATVSANGNASPQ